MWVLYRKYLRTPALNRIKDRRVFENFALPSDGLTPDSQVVEAITSEVSESKKAVVF